MPVYQAPLKDIRFILHEFIRLQTELLDTIPQFQDISLDLIDQALTEIAKITEHTLFPLNALSDKEGCQLKNGEVITPQGFKEAYRQFVAGGWLSLACCPTHGGQGMPNLTHLALEEMLCSGSVSFTLYVSLTHGIYRGLKIHGSDSQKRQYLPKLVTGEWAGVMDLTEPQSGSDLGLIKTRAQPQNDGTYKINGTKIFITGGEQNLTENIIHLVLARLPSAPAGPKGISLFLVPKYLIRDDGTLDTKKNVTCNSIEHKMGINGSATCVMNYDDATGYLVGEPNGGLATMFTIMNTERLAIGLQGLGLAEVAYQNAAKYAKERLQGRASGGAKYPDKIADPIVVHGDVRRMLLTMRAYTEGARALIYMTCLHVDKLDHHPDKSSVKYSEDMLSLLTPVCKAYITDIGFEVCNLGLQVFGGHGYIKEWGMEQYVRDARIAQIYEGTNGIQALDLVKRKVVADQGEKLQHFIQLITDLIADFQHHDDMKIFLEPFGHAANDLVLASQWLISHAEADPDVLGCNCSDYLKLFGLVALGFCWAKMASIAMPRQHEDSFYAAKVHTAEFFVTRLLPQTHGLLTIIQSGSHPIMQMPEECF